MSKKEYKETIPRERLLTKEAAYSELKDFMLRLFQKLGYEMKIVFRDDHETDMRTVVARWEEKPRTNADKLRAMSDEELAGYLTGVWYGFEETPGMCDVCDKNSVQNCSECWLDWLKQEAGE